MTSQDERFQKDSSLGQEWGKLADCPVYTPLEFKHGDPYWHPFGESGFGKCYNNGEAHLLLCLRSRRLTYADLTGKAAVLARPF